MAQASPTNPRLGPRTRGPADTRESPAHGTCAEVGLDLPGSAVVAERGARRRGSLSIAVATGLHEQVLDTNLRIRPLLDLLWLLTRPRGIPALLERGAPEVLLHRPRCSVIIPCYNYGHFLADAVSSVLTQEGVDVEVIVVDDASTDGSVAVAEALCRLNGNVDLVRNGENQGHIRSFNTGLQGATGQYVVRLDADDMLAPGSLSRAVGLLEAWPQVGLVYGHPRHFSHTQPPRPRGGQPTWTVWNGQTWLAERCRRGVNCITSPEVVLRRTVLEEVGNLDTRLVFAPDMELWLRVAAVADVGHVNGPDQALHRDHAASMTAGNGQLTDLLERRRVFELLFASVGPRIDGAADLQHAARLALAREALSAGVHQYDRGRYDPDELRQLVRFVCSLGVQHEQLPEWEALLVAGRLGPRRARRAAAALERTVRARVSAEVAYLNWTRTGLF